MEKCFIDLCNAQFNQVLIYFFQTYKYQFNIPFEKAWNIIGIYRDSFVKIVLVLLIILQIIYYVISPKKQRFLL